MIEPRSRGHLALRRVARRRHVALFTGGLCAVAFALAAMGSSSFASSPSHRASAKTRGTPASVVAAAKKDVQKAYGTGFVEPPPSSGPRAQTGKTVWWVSCGQIYPSCAKASDEFEVEAKLLGWHANVVDGKASSTTASALIRQAVAAHVDGIILDTYDCPGIKGALQAAKAAHIPTVSFAGFDCNSPVYHGTEGPSLYTAVTRLLGQNDPSALFSAWARMLAENIIAKTNGHTTFFYVSCTDNTVCQIINRAFQKAIKPCTGCDEVYTPYSFADVPNPATQEWKSALLAHPSVKVLQFIPAGLLGDGLQTAVKGAGHSFTLFGAEGSPQDYSLIRSGAEVSSVVRQDSQANWATADTMNRILAGENPKKLPNEGGGFQIVDKTHNLPASGTPKPARNFEAVYKKVWTGK